MKAKDLRNSILQMAVQGKLVEQEPNDEPASALLERIRTERARLIAEKKIRAPKGGESVIYRDDDGSYYEKRGGGEPVCIDDEIPFEIPESWEWARLESCCQAVVDCPHSTPTYLVEDTGYYAIDTNCMDDAWNQTGLRYLSENSYKERVARYAPQPGDLVLSREGSIGRSVILDQCNVCLGQRVMVLRFFADGLLNRFCQIVLSSPYAWGLYLAANVGTGVKHINVSMIKDILVPLPPSSEQMKIARVIDDVLPHIDQYVTLEDARERLDAELPDKLRKSVLQYAMQGKLVKQDPGDEPASALLDRIHDERARLIKTGGLRASKGGDSVIYRIPDGSYYEKRGKGEPRAIEVPFEIPDSWEWARLGTLFDMQAGKNISAAKISALQDDKHPFPCFGGNGIRGYVEFPNRKGFYPIVGRQGALCGCINYAEGEFYATEHAVVTTCFDETDVRWACMALEALNLNQYATSTAQPGLAVSKVIDVLIPVPPAAEQKRIMKKLNQILPHIGGRKEEE